MSFREPCSNHHILLPCPCRLVPIWGLQKSLLSFTVTKVQRLLRFKAFSQLKSLENQKAHYMLPVYRTENMHRHFKRDAQWHCEEILSQNKTESQRVKLQDCGSMSDVAGLRCLGPWPGCLRCTSLTWAGSTVQQSLADIPWLLHLNISGD